MQDALVSLLIGDGADVRGMKLGLTSASARASLGVDSAIHGWVTDTGELSGDVSASAFIRPRIEPEFALVLAEDIKGPGVTYSDVANATKEVRVAFEISDSRFHDWDFAEVDIVADNAAAAGYVLSTTAVSPFDLYFEEFTFTVNGDVVATGTGAAVEPDPFVATAKALNDAAERGLGLSEGQIVLTGALCTPVPLTAGSTYAVSCPRLGELAVTARY